MAEEELQADNLPEEQATQEDVDASGLEAAAERAADAAEI